MTYFIILAVILAIWNMWLIIALRNSKDEAKHWAYSYKGCDAEVDRLHVKIQQFEKELKIYADVCKEHGWEVKDE